MDALGQCAMRAQRVAVTYQMPSTCCMTRLTADMPIQQQNPIKIGFPPDFTSLTMLVFRPITAIAIMIKNLLKPFIRRIGIRFVILYK